jgi:DNA-binding SARP family transcriptional activator
MRFSLLGPLAVTEAGQPLELGPTKQRTLLACLLLQANQVVTTSDLIDAVWGERPPASAVKNLQLYVGRLRRTFAAVEPGQRLETAERGYRLRVAPEDDDLMVSRGLLAQARDLRRSGDLERALLRYEQAVALWRGRPLDGLATTAELESQADSLVETYLMLCQERFQVLHDCGRLPEALPSLRRLVAAHPQRESLRYHLMLALAQAGDRAAALASYRQCYRLFDTELGIEPGPELRDLHLVLLSGARPAAAFAMSGTEPAVG